MGLASILVDSAMAIGPVIGYIDQYSTMRKANAVEGFSSFVPCVLLISSILRITFGFGVEFNRALLVQSIIMMIMQILLLELLVRLKPKSPRVPLTTHTLFNKFWAWTEFSSYLAFLLYFCITICVITILFSTSDMYFQVIGIASASIEATLPVPQLIHLIRTKSAAGFSPLLLATWVLGDSFKTIYYIVREPVPQFIACGVFQLSVDIAIVFFVWKFGGFVGLFQSVGGRRYARLRPGGVALPSNENMDHVGVSMDDERSESTGSFRNDDGVLGGVSIAKQRSNSASSMKGGTQSLE